MTIFDDCEKKIVQIELGYYTIERKKRERKRIKLIIVEFYESPL